MTASIFVATAIFCTKASDFFGSYGVFNKPVSCQDGHSFCHHCITQSQSNHNYCPVDRTVLSGTLVRNLAVEGAISRKVMKCPSTISLSGGCKSGTFSVRPRSSVGRVTVDLIRRSWVRFPPRSKDIFLCLVWLPDSLY